MNRNNIYRLRLRELRDEFADRAETNRRKARLIENAERAEAQAELKRVSLTRSHSKFSKPL
jgi:hypothetical protein